MSRLERFLGNWVFVEASNRILVQVKLVRSKAREEKSISSVLDDRRNL
jgi:hypothetical protein